MADKAAIDPVTGNYLFASEEETTLQSKHNCFPLKIVFGRETKELLEEFRDQMKNVKELALTLPIETAMDSDLSAT
jgi:hypothetical protein